MMTHVALFSHEEVSVQLERVQNQTDCMPESQQNQAAGVTLSNLKASRHDHQSSQRCECDRTIFDVQMFRHVFHFFLTCEDMIH